VLFATHEQHTYGEKGHIKGISTGARVMHTERAAAFDAKNRHGLPATLPLDWQSLRDAIAAGQPVDPELTRQRILALLASSSLADELQQRVGRAVLAAGNNGAELARIQNKLQAQLNIQRKQEAT
jgi:hypothetical protein